MSRMVALLRAVNLGPHQKVSSAQLKSFGEALGFAQVQTLLNSGNLLFAPDAQKPEAIERRMESESAKRLKLPTDFFVRTHAELEKIVAGNPWPDAARTDPSHLVVLFFKEAPTRAGLEALRAAVVGREVLEVQGRHLYAHYRDGIGESKLTNKLIEKHLGGSCTGRNWNTVQKLLALTQT